MMSKRAFVQRVREDAKSNGWRVIALSICNESPYRAMVGVVTPEHPEGTYMYVDDAGDGQVRFW